ncbi:uncharacterized protein LOC135698867 [Ochlerotatus camptorhynchus]|uniref:uncharacterized protein LOC135698867 n=1 Tax=Ochlerotatus camptorhynchus TaxID=644619 RepID=UPI0031DC7174
MAPGGASTPSMRALTARLKQIQLSLNDIHRFIQAFTESNNITEVEVRVEKLDELWESFSATMVEIYAHDEFKAEKISLEKERSEFSDRYYEIKSFLMDKIKELQKPQVLEQSFRAGEGTTSVTMEHVRLPQIKLHTFSGDIDEWLSFRDLFTSLIHWKADLPDVGKFHYLKGCLQGEPKGLIDPLPITAANYQVAWDTLLKRYNNSKQLRKRQVQALFKLPMLSKESGADLHILFEGFERIVQTLDQVIQPAEYKDLLLVNILTARLDPVTRRGWEEVSSTKKEDTLEDLCEFIQRRIQVLDSLPPKPVDTRGLGQLQQQPKPKAQSMKVNYGAQTSTGRCIACSSDHLLHQCNKFQGMAVSDRDGLVKLNGLCRNCLRSGHHAKDCQSKFSCRNCKGRHHTLVCFKPAKEKGSKVATVAGGNKSSNSEDQQGSSGLSTTQVATVAATETAAPAAAQQQSTQVLLATAVVVIEDDVGNRHPARALLDSGSEINFITERLSQRLQVTRNRVDISVAGIGQAATKVRQGIQAVLRSRVSDFSRELGYLVLPKVTVNLPTATVNTDTWTIPSGIQLADPMFFESNAVDIVLGIECFFDFFETGRRISLGANLPSLNESVFGWVISGGILEPNRSRHINCNVSSVVGLDELISRFWSCEEVDSGKVHSLEEKQCEDNYVNTVQRGSDGRYTVSLPKDEDAISRLGESKDIAYRRLQGTERRLDRDPSLREQYNAFMEEYVKLGHMREVDETELEVKRCYLPHHPVLKEASTTTKVRVVFDASCKTSSGVSLNDVLKTGTVLQEELRSIILRSRTWQIMIVSDVEKMFRQILIFLLERALQCILWRFSPAEVIKIYELNTVTYGTKSAPFLATRTLKQLAMDEEKTFPLAARAVLEDTYMDDVITGANDVETARELQIQLNKMMSAGGFQLRKWASNCPAALTGVPEENLAIRPSDGIDLDPDPAVKTLGLTWIPSTDMLRFQFTIPTLANGELLTKWNVLSMIATLFDPLGLLGPVITMAKIFMQRLWTILDGNGHTLDWDHPLPPTVGEAWRKFHEQLPLLNQLHIERCVLIPETVAVEIHCFSDASEKAYGACLYLRSTNAGGEVKVRLLSSRSKVAPLKCQSIPRLELCGALLGAQLFAKTSWKTNSGGEDLPGWRRTQTNGLDHRRYNQQERLKKKNVERLSQDAFPHSQSSTMSTFHDILSPGYCCNTTTSVYFMRDLS